MKEVCHRKETISCDSFIQRKLMPKPLNTKAVRYGKSNEELAICNFPKEGWLNSKCA